MIEEKITDLWYQYQKGLSFNQKRGVFADTDRNFRFYNEDQWKGLESGGIEPVVFNIIKPIVKYKNGIINSNEFAINYSSENFDEPNFQMDAEKICEKLNKYAAMVFEKENMSNMIRKVSKRACINSEGIVYVSVDDNNNPKCEIINKNNVFYGNENDGNIQEQPYIIITSRKPLESVIEEAKLNNVSEEQLNQIVADKNNYYEAGDEAKQEVNDKVLVITKLWKEKGTVWFSKATKTVELVKATDTKLKLYPMAHFVWEDVEGSARGQGEVKWIIANQIEINKTLMRIVLAVKMGAYPTKVVNIDKILNPSAIDKVGATIKVKDMNVDDLKKYIGYLQPAQLNSNSNTLLNDLISVTRELAGAGDVATGDINPEQASGRSILAVQQASQMPLTEQSAGLKQFIEDLARIFFDIWQNYNTNGMNVYEEEEIKIQNVDGTITSETIKKPYKISKEILDKLRVSVKVDVTPKSPYDKLALEQSLENLLQNQFITFKEYVKSLPFDATMPKPTLERLIDDREKEQQKINQMEKEQINIKNQVNHYLNQNEKINQIDLEAEQLMSM